MVREGVRQGLVGNVADDAATYGPWGISAADVTQDVGVWPGSENQVCRSDAEYLAATIPRATYVVFPGDGHLVPLPRWAEMLAWLHCETPLPPVRVDGTGSPSRPRCQAIVAGPASRPR